MLLKHKNVIVSGLSNGINMVNKLLKYVLLRYTKKHDKNPFILKVQKCNWCKKAGLKNMRRH